MKPAVDGGLYGLTVCAVSFSGGAEEIRTPGLDNANVARSQLRYSPLLLERVIFYAPLIFLSTFTSNIRILFKHFSFREMHTMRYSLQLHLQLQIVHVKPHVI